LDFHQVDKIHMDPRSPTAEKLNVFQMDKAKVLPPSTLTFAGQDTPEFRDKVHEALRKQVGEGASAMIGPFVPPQISARNPARPVLLVCSIARQPFFTSHFSPEPTPRLFTDRLGVHHRTLGFGTSGRFAATYDDGVRVLADDLAGNHALRINFFAGGVGAQEFLVLSTPGKHQSMEEAIKEILTLLGKDREPTRKVDIGGVTHRYTDTLEAGDELWVPHLRARVLCDYPDLLKKPYLKSPDGSFWWEIRHATQLLNWKLDHTGAVVEATAVAASAPADPLGPAPAPSPAVPGERLPLYKKTFIFNKPFIATLWREGAEWPYLACWVDGPDMLAEKK
jgi:hypothetical protein